MNRNRDHRPLPDKEPDNGCTRRTDSSHTLLPGYPGNPSSPLRPPIPGKPLKPGSPGAPGYPLRPGSPGLEYPCLPGSPFWPE